MLRRIFEVEPLTCRDCGSETRVLSFITEPRVVTKILNQKNSMHYPFNDSCVNIDAEPQ